MITCNKCGFENPDDGKFCKNCGNRIDGKKACPFCGSDVLADTVFCPHCGKRVDGRKVCANCGNVLNDDDVFCGECGTPVKVSIADSPNGQNKKDGKRDKIFSILKNCLFITGLLVAFICSFFIGAGTVMSAYGRSIRQDLDTITYLRAVFSEKYWADIITGIILILNILNTFAMLLASSLIYGLKRKNIGKFFYSGLFSTLISCAFILLMSAKMSESGANVSVTLSLGGIFAIAIMMAIALSVKITSVVFKKLDGGKITSSIIDCVAFAVSCVAILGVAFPLLSYRGVYSLSSFVSEFGTQYVEAQVCLGLAIFAIILMSMPIILNDGKCGVIGIIFSAVTLCLQLGFTIGFGVQYISPTNGAAVYCGVIIGLIFTLAALVLNIVVTVFERKNRA